MKFIYWMIALLGLWEFGDISLPFIIGYEQVPPAVWSHIGVGLVLIVAGAWAALTPDRGTARTLAWIAIAGGGWLVIGRILFNTSGAAGLWNDIIVGLMVIILGVWAASRSVPL